MFLRDKIFFTPNLQIEKQCHQTCHDITSRADEQKKRACIESQKTQNQTIDQIRPLEVEWKKRITKHREEELIVRKRFDQAFYPQFGILVN